MGRRKPNSGGSMPTFTSRIEDSAIIETDGSVF
jgi:hypothetical protein